MFNFNIVVSWYYLLWTMALTLFAVSIFWVYDVIVTDWILDPGTHPLVTNLGYDTVRTADGLLEAMCAGIATFVVETDEFDFRVYTFDYTAYAAIIWLIIYYSGVCLRTLGKPVVGLLAVVFGVYLWPAIYVSLLGYGFLLKLVTLNMFTISKLGNFFFFVYFFLYFFILLSVTRRDIFNRVFQLLLFLDNLLFTAKQNTSSGSQELRSMFVQFGPQHPGSHGLIKFTLELSGETITSSILYIGLLHRGTEKLMETRAAYMGTPYMDRLDYVSTLTSEHAHVLAIEGLVDFQVVSPNFAKIRTVFDEITRIKNHLMHISILTFDTGNFFIFFFFLEWREHLMGFYEGVSGARLHAAMYRPFENRFNYFNTMLIDSMVSYLNYFLFFFKNFFQPLLFFRILKLRFVGVGVLSKSFTKRGSISGVIARSTGLRYDARIPYQTSYAYYKFLSFKTFVGANGDLYDRMLLMVVEIVESSLIISQVLFKSFVMGYSSTSRRASHRLELNYVEDVNRERLYS